ncbi:MAG: hypothetical protein NXI24_23495 [bacterium]|nr:hypothetical protein [bacterium]
MRAAILIGILAGAIACTPASGNEPGSPADLKTDLEDYLKAQFTYVIDLQGFYIVSSDEPPLHASPESVSAEEAAIYAADIFAAMLDQNNDGRIDRPRLLESLRKHLVFGIGYERTLEKHEEYVERNLDRYMMSMKTDIWDLQLDFEKFEIEPGEALNSSTWRPPGTGALREEAYHTITEAMRYYNSAWSFDRGSKLHTWMAADRKRGLYDTEEQNIEEDGQYDDATAVNELIHQVWIFDQAGAADQLTANQKRILKLIRRSGLDLNVNGRRDGRRLYKIYECARGNCAIRRAQP